MSKVLSENGLSLDMITVISSIRIRLARNLADYNFPAKLGKKQAEEVARLVKYELSAQDEFIAHEVRTMGETEAKILEEKHLISPALLKNKDRGVAFVSKDGHTCVMVNEEDHLREQYFIRGSRIDIAYDRLASLDEQLAKGLKFAYDSKLGFLTACPSNLGTGMRASIMMFLPGLTWSEKIGEISAMLKSIGMTIRGAFGEGSEAEGFEYQISNERTLGVSESEILEMTEEAMLRVAKLELHARDHMLEQEEIVFKDVVYRSFAILTSCRLISAGEVLTELANVKLGVALGFLTSDKYWEFLDFIESMRPATFHAKHCTAQMQEREVDEIRANVVRKSLPEFIRMIPEQ